MNINGIGSVSSYVKGLSLDKKWQEKKKNITKDETMDPKIAEMKQWAVDQRRSQSIGSIYGKMMAGASLTQDELDYLKANAPEQYEKAVQIQREREAYKKELANCKSKEDVEKLNQRKMNEFCNEAKSIAGNPNIPKGKKKELLEFITMRMNAVINDHTEFVKSKEYSDLPDKADSLGREIKPEQSNASQDEAVTDDGTAVDDVGDPVKAVQDMLEDVSQTDEPEHDAAVSEASGKTTPVSTKQAAIHAYSAHTKASPPVADKPVNNRGGSVRPAQTVQSKKAES